MKIINEDKYPYYKVIRKRGNINNVIAVYNVEPAADALLKVLTKYRANDANYDSNDRFFVLPSDSVL